jgi:hypothetical protein
MEILVDCFRLGEIRLNGGGCHRERSSWPLLHALWRQGLYP